MISKKTVQYEDPQMGETNGSSMIVPDKPFIQLNDLEIEVAVDIAKKRQSLNRKNKVKSVLVKNNPDEADREGVLSELAFCRIAKVYPHEVFRLGYTSKRFGGDKGDVFLGDLSIDVKSTTHPTGRLITMFDNKLIDYYALMVGKDGAYTLAGLKPRTELCTEDRFGHHQIFRKACYMAKQEELLSWTEFLKKELIND